jgi:uncharacterized protein YcfL
MKKYLFSILCIIFFVGCDSTTLKEFSDNDVEYDQKNNTWVLKSDGTTIKESFVINDELFDGVNPHKREVIS